MGWYLDSWIGVINFMNNDHSLRKIGILTSGGDAPGMNSCIRAVGRTAIYHDIQLVGIREGFDGLIRGDMQVLNARDLGGILQRGGTVLQTGRSEYFRETRGQREALRQ